MLDESMSSEPMALKVTNRISGKLTEKTKNKNTNYEK